MIISPKEDLTNMDGKIRRIMAMSGCLHLRSNMTKCPSEYIGNYTKSIASNAQRNGTSIYQQLRMSKFMRDMTILSDKRLKSNRPDITFLYKIGHVLILIDIAVPWDINIVKEEQVKIQKYQNMTEQIEKMYQVAAQVVFLVHLALSSRISLHLKTPQDYLASVDVLR